MALFLRIYLYVPENDRKKTTLKGGNPHRLDHLVLGATMIQGSLYKPPKTNEIKAYWLWDDTEFDPDDPLVSEKLLLEKIFHEINREMERVQQDKQISFPAHYLVGEQLTRTLGFFHQRSLYHHVSRPGITFHTFLGATPIDMGTVGGAKETTSQPLKPKPLYVLTNKKIRQEFEIWQLYDNYNWDRIESIGTKEVLVLIELYHQMK